MGNSAQIKVPAKCIACSVPITVCMEQDTYDTEFLRDAVLNNAQCSSCIEAQKTIDCKNRHDQRIANREFLNKSTYEARRKASRLDFYHLAYDPQDPRANPKLFEWVGSRLDQSILLTGETGQCKTRIIQYYAHQLLLAGKKVLFMPTADLLDEISDAFLHKKQGREFMRELKQYDLLILDDLGKSSETPAKLQRLWQLIDRRYVRHDQKINIEMGKWNPMFYKKEVSEDGWQLWITTNCAADKLAERFDAYRNEAGDPIIRRITDMCEIPLSVISKQ